MKNVIFAVLLALAVPFTASAADPSFTYLEGGFSRSDLGVVEGNGGFLKGSVDFSDTGVYGFASATQAKLLGVTVTNWDAGLGYAHALPQTTLFGEVAYTDVDASGLASVDGVRVGLGARTPFADSWEVLTQANWRRLDGQQDWSGVLGVRHTFADSWSVGATVEFGEDDFYQYGLGVRYSF